MRKIFQYIHLSLYLSFFALAFEAYAKKKNLQGSDLSSATNVQGGTKVCELSIKGNDQMQFDKKQLKVDGKCSSVKLVLKHTGKLPKAVMGHNWVLVKAKDMTTVMQSALAAGPTKDYIPADKSSIVAHTELIGGGETTSVSFDVSKLNRGESYKFFCSFPGHFALMQGDLVLKGAPSKSAPQTTGQAGTKACELKIGSNDQMQFDKKKLEVARSCSSVKLVLKHTGKLPKAAMGHNWVLVKAKDMTAVMQSALAAGPTKGYIPADKSSVIAHTGLIGGGETTSVSFDVSKLKRSMSYKFFCSFPGHFALMQGDFVLN